MMNPPTNSEIPAKTSKKVSTKPSMVEISSRASSRAVSPVTTSTGAASVAPAAGRTAASTRSASTVSSTLPSPRTEMVETMPSGENAAAAVASSKNTMVAPAIEAPMSTMPVSVASVSCPPTTRVVVSPTASPVVSSAPASSMNSAGPLGAAPSEIGVAGSSAYQASPKVGAPVVGGTVPSAPTSTSGPVRSAKAWATPSTCATVVTRSAGIVLRTAPALAFSCTRVDTSSAPRRYTSDEVPASTIPSKVSDSISRSEKVPATKETPRTTARMDSPRRTRCAWTLRSATRSISPSPSGA